ncbi:hypothetical protein QC760_001409 [Botrytis cinerea]
MLFSRRCFCLSFHEYFASPSTKYTLTIPSSAGLIMKRRNDSIDIGSTSLQKQTSRAMASIQTTNKMKGSAVSLECDLNLYIRPVLRLFSSEENPQTTWSFFGPRDFRA